MQNKKIAKEGVKKSNFFLFFENESNNSKRSIEWYIDMYPYSSKSFFNLSSTNFMKLEIILEIN